MKKFVFIALFLGISLSGFSQSDTVWYKVYTGKFGNSDATLHLCRHSNSYSGYIYIWFTQQQWPMPVYGSPSPEYPDSIQLSAGNSPLFLNLTGLFKINNFIFDGHGHLQKDNVTSKEVHFSLQENKSGNYTAFQYFYTGGTASLPPKLKNESTCDFSSEAVWPLTNTAFTTSLKKQIGIALNSKVPVNNPLEIMNIEKNKFMTGWQKDNSKLTAKDAADMGLSLSASQDQNIMVMYEDEKTLTLANYISTYSGGAHNNYYTSLITISKKTGKKLQLKDVLSAEGLKLLPSLLDKVARQQFSINNKKPLDENGFFVNQIKATENFYVTSTGIGFLYPTYELKSLAEGEINLLVPKVALAKYLTPEYR